MFLEYNPASGAGSNFSKHCYCGNKLNPCYLAAAGRQVCSPTLFTHFCSIVNLDECSLALLCTCLPYSGSAAACCLAQIFLCSILFAQIRWKKLHVTTWGGNFTGTASLLCSHDLLYHFILPSAFSSIKIIIFLPLQAGLQNHCRSGAPS